MNLKNIRAFKIRAFKMILLENRPIWGFELDTVFYKWVIQLGWWQVGEYKDSKDI